LYSCTEAWVNSTYGVWTNVSVVSVLSAAIKRL